MKRWFTTLSTPFYVVPYLSTCRGGWVYDAPSVLLTMVPQHLGRHLTHWVSLANTCWVKSLSFRKERTCLRHQQAKQRNQGCSPGLSSASPENFPHDVLPSNERSVFLDRQQKWKTKAPFLQPKPWPVSRYWVATTSNERWDALS